MARFATILSTSLNWMPRGTKTWFVAASSTLIWAVCPKVTSRWLTVKDRDSVTNRDSGLCVLSWNSSPACSECNVRCATLTNLSSLPEPCTPKRKKPFSTTSQTLLTPAFCVPWQRRSSAKMKYFASKKPSSFSPHTLMRSQTRLLEDIINLYWTSITTYSTASSSGGPSHVDEQRWWNSRLRYVWESFQASPDRRA